MSDRTWPAVGAIVWVLPVLVTLAGCVSYGASSSPFIIKKGSGPVNAGHAAAVPKVDRASLDRASREAIAQRAARKPQGPPSIEQIDPALRNAMAGLNHQASAEAHVRVAQRSWRLHVFDAAYDHYSAAISLEPRNIPAWEGRARVWRDWHLPAPALSDVYRARFYAPHNPQVLNTLGTILELVGQCGAARDAYASALKLDPAAVWARDNLVRLEGRTDNCGR